MQSHVLHTLIEREVTVCCKVLFFAINVSGFVKRILRAACYGNYVTYFEVLFVSRT